MLQEADNSILDEVLFGMFFCMLLGQVSQGENPYRKFEPKSRFSCNVSVGCVDGFCKVQGHYLKLLSLVSAN